MWKQIEIKKLQGNSYKLSINCVIPGLAGIS